MSRDTDWCVFCTCVSEVSVSLEECRRAAAELRTSVHRSTRLYRTVIHPSIPVYVISASPDGFLCHCAVEMFSWTQRYDVMYISCVSAVVELCWGMCSAAEDLVGRSAVCGFRTGFSTRFWSRGDGGGKEDADVTGTIFRTSAAVCREETPAQHVDVCRVLNVLHDLCFLFDVFLKDIFSVYFIVSWVVCVVESYIYFYHFHD